MHQICRGINGQLDGIIQKENQCCPPLSTAFTTTGNTPSVNNLRQSLLECGRTIDNPPPVGSAYGSLPRFVKNPLIIPPCAVMDISDAQRKHMHERNSSQQGELKISQVSSSPVKIESSTALARAVTCSFVSRALAVHSSSSSLNPSST